MNIITADDALHRLNEAAQRGGLTLSRGTFKQSILPLMAKNGDAQKIGDGRRGQWIVNSETSWRWEDYIAKRAALITLGYQGWHEKRPYDILDMINLVDEGVYDDEIDHPVFTHHTHTAHPASRGQR